MSYVVLNIDTTNPHIEVYAPSYTTPDVVNTITIESSEPVAIYQDIYIIDSQNVRHDYTFLKEDENTYVGRVRFNNLPYGVHTIYARLKDDVDNYSNTAMKSFEMRESLFKGNVTTSHKAFNNADASNREMINVETKDYKQG